MSQLVEAEIQPAEAWDCKHLWRDGGEAHMAQVQVSSAGGFRYQRTQLRRKGGSHRCDQSAIVFRLACGHEMLVSDCWTEQLAGSTAMWWQIHSAVPLSQVLVLCC